MISTLPAPRLAVGAASLDSVSCALSLLATMAIGAVAFEASLGQSGGNGLSFIVLGLLGVQLASAGFVLGVASLWRFPRSAKAWTGSLLGLAILGVELVFVYTMLSRNYGY